LLTPDGLDLEDVGPALAELRLDAGADKASGFDLDAGVGKASGFEPTGLVRPAIWFEPHAGVGKAIEFGADAGPDNASGFEPGVGTGKASGFDSDAVAGKVSVLDPEAVGKTSEFDRYAFDPDAGVGKAIRFDLEAGVGKASECCLDTGAGMANVFDLEAVGKASGLDRYAFDPDAGAGMARRFGRVGRTGKLCAARKEGGYFKAGRADGAGLSPIIGSCGCCSAILCCTNSRRSS
jgi:hypothetical protein